MLFRETVAPLPFRSFSDKGFIISKMAASMCCKMAAIFNQNLFVPIFFLFSVSVGIVLTARLSDPKILLPYHSSVITNFTLTINLTKDEARSVNCYTW